jgi:hypothetical protein
VLEVHVKVGGTPLLAKSGINARVAAARSKRLRYQEEGGGSAPQGLQDDEDDYEDEEDEEEEGEEEGAGARRTRRRSSRGTDGGSGGSAGKPKAADVFKRLCTVRKLEPERRRACISSLTLCISRTYAGSEGGRLQAGDSHRHHERIPPVMELVGQAAHSNGAQFARRLCVARPCVRTDYLSNKAMLFHDTSGGDWKSAFGAEFVLNPCQAVCGLRDAKGNMCGTIFTLTKGSIDRGMQHWNACAKKERFKADALRVLARWERLKAHALPLDGTDSAPTTCPPPTRSADITELLLETYSTYVPFSHELNGFGSLITGAAHVRPIRCPGDLPATVTTMEDIALALRSVVDGDFARQIAASAGIVPWPPLSRVAGPLDVALDGAASNGGLPSV